jgi:hypothetical protein
MRDEELWAIYLPALKRINPTFDPTWILAKTINRGEYAQPIVGANYSEILPSIKTGVPGLYSAAMAQIYPEDRGQNYAVKLAREAAAVMVGELG